MHTLHTYMNTLHTLHAYMHAYIHTYMHACMHTYTHTCMHACMHTYIHTYIHILKEVLLPVLRLPNCTVQALPFLMCGGFICGKHYHLAMICRPRHRWQKSIETDLEGGVRICLGDNKEHWRAFVGTAMSLWVAKQSGKLLSS
jgi:hypothetical protein